MRYPILAAAAALVLAVAAAAQDREGGRGRGRRTPPAVELKHFDHKDVEFDAASLADGKGAVGLYLPKGWDAEANAGRKYPVVVWLHGFGGYGEFLGEGGAATLDRLRGQGDIPELVVATFRAPGRGRRARTTYLNGEAAGNVEDAISKDLMKFLVDEYPVSADRAQHAIMGISIGGYGALKIGMRHKATFGVVAAHSAAVFPDDPAELPPQYERQIGFMMQRGGLGEVFGDPIDKARWAAEMPLGIVREAEAGAFDGLAIYFDAGSEDRYGFAPLNEALSKAMQAKGIEHTFRLVEGGGHAWGSESMLPNLEQSLKFVAACFAGKQTEKVEKAEVEKADK